MLPLLSHVIAIWTEAASTNSLIAFSLVTGLAGLIAAGFALRLTKQFSTFRQEAGTDKARGEATTAFLQALLDNGPDGLVVGPGSDQRYFGKGKKLFELLMESPDAPHAMQALDRLAKEGTVFSLSARVPGGVLELSGAPVGKHAALYISERVAERSAEAQLIKHLPLAVATFDSRRKLTDYNEAYARLWDLPAAWLESRPSLGEILNRLREQRRIPEQRNFAQWRKSQIEAAPLGDQSIAQTWHLPSGQSIRLLTQAHWDGGIVVLCEDISEKLKLESAFNLLTQVQKATLDSLDEGVAIFGADGRLVLHNALFAKLWKLSESDLADQPHLASIAGSCARRIGQDGIWGIVAAGVSAATPERFAEWGKARRADGRIISVSLSRLPNGATMASFADLTDVEKFHLLQHKVSAAPAALKYQQSA